MGGVRPYFHQPPGSTARRREKRLSPPKAENNAGGEENRQDRYPDQNRSHHGQHEHRDHDAYEQHEDRKAERSEPGDVEAMRSTGRRRHVRPPNVVLPFGVAPAPGRRNNLRLQAWTFRPI
jgi:hypothetical protein